MQAPSVTNMEYVIVLVGGLSRAPTLRTIDQPHARLLEGTLVVQPTDYRASYVASGAAGISQMRG